MEAYKKGKLTF